MRNLSSELGRALHSLQDNCGHHGMVDPPHAFLAVEDTCSGTGEHPDSQDDALACAREETRGVSAGFSSLADSLGLQFSSDPEPERSASARPG